MEQLIDSALKSAGYTCNPTPENLIDCFKDYVDAGIWRNIDIEDVEDISIRDMCIALIKL